MYCGIADLREAFEERLRHGDDSIGGAVRLPAGSETRGIEGSCTQRVSGQCFLALYKTAHSPSPLLTCAGAACATPKVAKAVKRVNVPNMLY